uniref:Uncharacterized protein n=1 Tax=Timema cristinae TaxID=61476 RepID=A0A7R9CTS7_TIMCR|nr:unnamed protein product [Timema cristinae]
MTVFGVRHLKLTYNEDNNGRRVWLEITDLDIVPKSSESLLELDLGSNDGWFQPFQIAGHLTDGAYLSHEERLMMWLRTGDEPLGRGFKAIYKSDWTLALGEELAYSCELRLMKCLYGLRPPTELDLGTLDLTFAL